MSSPKPSVSFAPELEPSAPIPEPEQTIEQAFVDINNYYKAQVASTRYNSGSGIVPSQRCLDEKWNAIVPLIPAFDLHHISCPRNPNCERRFMAMSGGRVHFGVKSLCTCDAALTQDQVDVFEYITKVATSAITGDLSAILNWSNEQALTEALAACVAEKAVFLENAYAEVLSVARDANDKTQAQEEEPKGALARDIEVYMGNHARCEEFLRSCVFYLRVINQRTVTVTREGYIISRHELNQNERSPSILIKIMPHKAIRKGWNPNPASFVYIDDAMRVDRNTASLRAFATGNIFGSMGKGKDFRRLVIVGGNCNDPAGEILAYHDWVDFRILAKTQQAEKFSRYQKELQQYQREQLEQINKSALKKEEQKQKTKEEEEEENKNYSKAVEPRPMTDEEFEARAHYKKIKEMKALEKKIEQGVSTMIS